MSLTSEGQRRIAAMLAVVSGGRTVRRYAGADVPRGTLAQALRSAGQVSPTSGSGPAVAPERLALAALVRSGRLTADEADAFMAARYPGQRFSGGRFGDRAQSVAEAERAAPGAIRAASEANPTVGADPASPLRVGRLPNGWDQAQAQDVLERLAEGVSNRLQALRTTPPSFPVHSLDGAALAPGSVPVEALDQPAAARRLVELPRPEEAVELDLTQSLTMDRLVSRASTATSGPGRIWTAKARPGPASRIGVGATRYRVVRAGQRFGVMSCRLPPDTDMAANNVPGIAFQYGIVVAQIPHFLGRPPSRILSVEAVGDAPTSFRTLFNSAGGGVAWASGGTTRDFYWQRTTEEHLTLAPYPFADAFGSDANLGPSSSFLRDIWGFSFQLVTGRDGGEVFRQLCSRRTLGRGLYQSGHGPAASIPAGLPLESPAPASVVDWNGATTYTHRIETYDLTTAGTKVAIGMPFGYDDCAALVPTDTHFSMVVMPIGEKLLSQAGLASLATPEEWHRNGLRTTGAVSGRLRNWALDAIVD